MEAKLFCFLEIIGVGYKAGNRHDWVFPLRLETSRNQDADVVDTLSQISGSFYSELKMEISQIDVSHMCWWYSFTVKKYFKAKEELMETQMFWHAKM
jgi:hypothetical protein